MPTTTTNTRPTDAELVKLLRSFAEELRESDRIDPLDFPECTAVYNRCNAAADALEAASAEPPPLAHITTIRELFEVIDWDFDGNGLTVTDGNLLANTIANTFPTLKNDMPHLVADVE